MVVILQSAVTVFWLEYRRYVRTRRYWALTLTTLLLGYAFCLLQALLASRAPEAASHLFGLSYSGASMVGAFTWLPVIVAMPLTSRVLRDVYKTRTLTDLYLTELHPLGVALGRIGAIAALVGVSLLTLTPAALWTSLLVGVPLWLWLGSALLALAAYALGAAIDAYAMRGLHAPDESSLLPTRYSSYQAAMAMLPLGVVVVGLWASLSPNAQLLWLLPVWSFMPFTAPFLLSAAQNMGVLLSTTTAGIGCTLGMMLWCALGAAQWRDWWSEGAYRLMRWGGTALWLVLLGVHGGVLARALATSPLAAERLLLALLCMATLFNLGVATLAGYFALARRPAPLRFALPYPFGGLLWQWALQWLTAGVLYLAIGWASGQWVAPAKWLLWSLYAWAGGVVLSQALFSASWAYLSRYPNPLQGDYFNGFFINTRQTRAYYETRSQMVAQGCVLLAAILGILILCSLAVRLVNGAFFHSPALDVLASGLMRLHPWWGFYQEWQGLGGGERYVLYSLGWAVLLGVWWGRLGWRTGAADKERFTEWRREQIEEQRPETA